MRDRPDNVEWTPHIWEGANFHAWVRLLAKHRFAVHPRYWWVAATATIVSFLHSVIALLQQAFLRHRIVRTPIPRDPLFILGHWRTGTTLLHEYLIRDPRHTFPNTYQCMEPNHFLLTEKWITRALPFLMPKRRPMDDMPAGWDRPQEDEFALCLMGLPSIYTHLGFPNQRPVDFDWLDFRGKSASQKRAWGRGLTCYLRTIATIHPGKRLVLKSPPHTARVAELLRLFPGARFIHVVRDPYRVFPSTLRLWKSLYARHSLQVPDLRGLEDFVFEAGTRLYEALERDRNLIPAGRFYECKYEDFIGDPIGCLRSMYSELELGDPAPALPHFAAFYQSQCNYRASVYTIDEEMQAKVNRHWGDIARRHGYKLVTSD